MWRCRAARRDHDGWGARGRGVAARRVRARVRVSRDVKRRIRSEPSERKRMIRRRSGDAASGGRMRIRKSNKNEKSNKTSFIETILVDMAGKVKKKFV